MSNNDATNSSTFAGTYTVTFAANNCTCATGGIYYYAPPPRRILVKLPTRWKQKGKDAFIKMVNDETSTGWKCTMVIHGKVEIIDPNIVQMTAKQFLAVMRWNASQYDKAVIDEFAKDFKP